MAPVPSLAYDASSPPLALIACAAAGSVALQLAASPAEAGAPATEPVLTLASGAKVSGAPSILRHLARAGGLYGASAEEAAEVDQWLDFCAGVTGQTFEAAASAASEWLTLATFLVGHSLTAADVALWATVATQARWRSLQSKPAYAHLARYLAHVALHPGVGSTLAAHGRQPPAAAAKGKGKDDGGKGKGKGSGKGDDKGAGEEGEAGTFIDLPGAVEGGVVTRFPPEPSGYLHIGHAKAALLNDYFARRYKGTLLLRFDDTNPSKEKQDFVDNIIQDLGTLGIRHDKLSYTSDWFDEIMRRGEALIKEGVFYCDDTPQEQMRAERGEGTPSKWRGAPIEQHLEMWREMQAGSERGLQCCVRAKIDMSALNKVMRDPVMFRCNLTPHHRTGTKYKVYPTYDCCCPLVDSLEGVTHALRSSEYHDRNELYAWMLRAWKVREVHMWDFSRLNFVYTLLSKRKLQWFVDQGRVPGWDDPRFPTVQGMIRRGMTVQALREFIISQGASKNLNLMEWDKIWTINKKIVDPTCPRHTAIVDAGRVAVTVANGPAEPEVKTVPKHKKYPPAGVKATVLSRNLWIEGVDAQAVTAGQELTLMDWGNLKVSSVDVCGEGGAVVGDFNPDGDFKKTVKLTWLSADADLVPLRLVDYGHLITKPKLEEGDDFQSVINDESERVTPAHGDANMRSLRRGELIQLERKGYYIVDTPYTPGSPITLFSVPDGGKSQQRK